MDSNFPIILTQIPSFRYYVILEKEEKHKQWEGLRVRLNHKK
jgi:hypothetical protein